MTACKYSELETSASKGSLLVQVDDSHLSLTNCGSNKYHKMHSRRKYYSQSTLIGLGIWSACILMSFWCGWPKVFFVEEVSFLSNPQMLSFQALQYKQFTDRLRIEENLTKMGFDYLIGISPFELPTTLQNEDNYIESQSFRGNDTRPYPPKASSNQCDYVPVHLRFDCLPEQGKDAQETCVKRGCCWKEVDITEVPPRRNVHSRLRPSAAHASKGAERDPDVPFCFYPMSFSLYAPSDIRSDKDGIRATLKSHSQSGYPKDVSTLALEVRFETCSRVRIRISDPARRRWETPLPSVPPASPGCHGVKRYDVEVGRRDGAIVVSRTGSSQPLFDTRGAAPLIYSDQLLQLSTLLPSSFVYGLGQHLEGLLLDTYWKRRVLWNADAIPQPESNLYGSHPFYMVLEPAGSAHGVFLLNSNAIEVILQPTPALTFRATGGILDLYVFLGPSPDQVISQYTEVIGRPFLPPYWSLGYHQCRFGYKSVEETKKVWKRTRDAGIPFDVQWNDIDYMERQNDFTIDPLAFADLPEFVDELHQVGMRYVIITDPGISAGEKPGTYAPFDLGMKDDVFVKNSSGLPFIGKVWNPLATVFPDFTRPNAVVYWTSLISEFRKRLPFDGLWIDMNEPSNFWDGQKHGCPKNSSLEHPPFLPRVNGGLLSHKTLCMTARQYIGLHYNVHNLYGISEAIATNAALKMTKGTEDPFIISRSSFPGLGKYAGHWSGDVYSDWFNLWKSIGSVLTTNLLGIPMVGADICGFNGNTTVALCNRWMQLGAFYPFSRNHNTDDGIDQDPVALGELVVRSSVKALTQRYTLLPFLYTLFAKAHSSGIPVARPLFFKYPQDSETYAIDTQFLWGNELLIIPVLEENATSVEAYFPEGKWYDWYSGHMVSLSGQEYLSLPAALDTIPLVVAGGSVLPCQNPANTTTQSRLNPFGLVIALNEDGQARGELVWNKPQDPGFTEWTFRAISNHFTAVPVVHKPDEEVLTLEWITFYGVTSKVFWVKVNGAEVNYVYSAVSQTIRISNMAVNFKEPISVLYF